MKKFPEKCLRNAAIKSMSKICRNYKYSISLFWLKCWEFFEKIVKNFEMNSEYKICKVHLCKIQLKSIIFQKKCAYFFNKIARKVK